MSIFISFLILDLPKLHTISFNGGGALAGDESEDKEEDLKPVMSFKEVAASDPNLSIIMTLFICTKSLEGVCFSSDFEVLRYHWYKLGEKEYKISEIRRFRRGMATD